MENKVAFCVSSKDRPDLVKMMHNQSVNQTVSSDFYVAECNTSDRNLYKHDDVTIVRDNNKEFLGKCHGHNVLIDSIDLDKYDYIVIAMNDAVIPDNCLEVMINYLEDNNNVGLLAPRYKEQYTEFTYVDSFDYIFFMMRSDLIKEGLFLNREFKYCWGAIHDLCYRSYERGYYAAICPEIKYKHLGGNTYGKSKGTISRNEYLRQAPTFAYTYFKDKFGEPVYKHMKDIYPADVNTNRVEKNLKYWKRVMEGGKP